MGKNSENAKFTRRVIPGSLDHKRPCTRRAYRANRPFLNMLNTPA